MDIFEELFGNVLSEDEVRELIFLRNNNKLRVSYKGDRKLQPNPKQIQAFTRVLANVYKLAEGDEEFVWEGVLTEDKAVYAHWNGLDNVDYSVFYWLENANDDEIDEKSIYKAIFRNENDQFCEYGKYNSENNCQLEIDDIDYYHEILIFMKY